MTISSIPLPGFGVNERRPATVRRGRRRAPAVRTQASPPDSWVLFENLRLIRSRLARELKVKPRAVLPDKTLMQLVRVRPTDSHALLNVYGFGKVKSERFGHEFLQAIREFEGDYGRNKAA
jgi:ATP-dependent DNA helicase RecQ